MRSIIQDGSDDMPPTKEGALPYVQEGRQVPENEDIKK